MNQRTGRPDVVVIGGGIIGCSVAWELARRGVSVTVVERGVPGREATWAAAGMLAPLDDADTPGPFLELARVSLRRFPAYAEAVRDASGLAVELRADGKLQVALDTGEADELAARHERLRDAGLPLERLDGEEARRLEPALSPDVRAALFLPDDCHVDNRMLGRALWLAAARAGAAFRLGTAAARIRTTAAASGARGRGRVAGVDLADGETLAADRVLVAAGSWSAQLTGLPRTLPVLPVRGQMLAVETVPPALRRVVLGAGCYLVPRSSGRTLIGATVEHAGFLKHPTAAGVRSLLDAALRAVPGLADAPLTESWAGLRPGTPDELPILGPDPDVQGLFYATGHFRNGILLAPITAEVMADVITGAPPSLSLDTFAADRFPTEPAP